MNKRGLLLAGLLLLNAGLMIGNAAADTMSKTDSQVAPESASAPAGGGSAANSSAGEAAAEPRKPNYFIPVIAGAVGGILLALWLRRRKG